MFLKRERRIVGLVLAGCLTFTAEFEVLAAEPQPEAQAIVTNYEIEMSSLAEAWSQIPEVASMAEETQEWYGKALANTDSQLNVYTDMTEESAAVGVMYTNTVLAVEEAGEEWTKVSSGAVSGYVRNEWIVTGSAAVERAKITCANGTQDAKTVEEIAKEQRRRNLPQVVQNVDTVTLMAGIIYCEAGNQPYEGKVAVGAVVMNRVASGRFPNSIEEVIYQRGQFTPAMTGKLARVISAGRIPESCFQAARAAMAGETTVGNALYFNTGHGRFKLGDHYFS